MIVTDISFSDETGNRVNVTTDEPGVYNAPWPIPSRHSDQVQPWLDANGGNPNPYVAPPASTQSEKFDSGFNSQELLVAFVKCLNDGTFVPGQNYTTTQMKTIISTKL